MSPQAPAVRVRDLRHRYGETVALDGVSFEVPDGEIFGVLGPNGGGKTTMFRILSTLLPVDRGHVEIFGADVAVDLGAVRRSIGVVFQSPSLDIKLTVRENMRCHGSLYGITGRDLAARIDEGLATLGLTDRADVYVETLSGGLKRRVELAKGLLSKPRMLILDEPSTGLDPGARRDLWDYILALRSEQGTTVLVTTHLMDEAERCDRLAILDRGRVVAIDTPDAMRSRIGGDVLTIRSADSTRLQAEIEKRWGIAGSCVDGSVRLEHADARGLVREIYEAFPDDIESIQLARPTLEDVFIHETGHQLWND
ncbi:MAG TPA: ATP-binding cassette domain-containing protein [Candidatus Limnocylindrales bacterium]|nr:ATP-binding cassette domain-containing protein [Candidatus Limnocylindrales bacterium]